MRTLWILVAVLGVSFADLPSCTRARCSHCDVHFIAKMCQTSCQACPQAGVDVRSGIRLRHYPEDNRLPFSTHHKEKKEPYDEVKSQKPLKKQPTGARQAGVSTETRRQAPSNVAYPPLYQNVQFAAPQGQVPVIQYNQPVVEMSTLAPLVQPPRPIDINGNLASQPADLAQPMPEYRQGAQNQGGFAVQQPTPNFQAPAQTPYYNANQNFQQQTMAPFGQLPYQAQAGQEQQYSQQQQTASPLLNPFQPFMQQQGATGAQSLLDPFGLFNFAGMANLAQGTPMGQVQATTAPFAQPQQGFAAAPVAQPLQPAQPTLQQMPPYYSQPQPQPQLQQPQQQQQQQFSYNQQPNPNLQQNVQPNVAAQQQAGPQQPASVQNVYYPPNNNYQPQQLPRNQQQPSRTNQQPTPLYHTQHQQPRPHNQASPLPKQQPSQSIDATPITVHKYFDGKGPAPSSLPQQCPRQPGWAPCITKQEANARFTNCCARLGDGCLPLCNYDAPLATMQLAVLTGRCPLSKMADIMVCASGYEDATSCCEAYNVFEPGYEQCRPYCNPAAGLPQGGPLSEKYKCLVKLGHIQQCFYVSQKP